jgi:hypothetical protein
MSKLMPAVIAATTAIMLGTPVAAQVTPPPAVQPPQIQNPDPIMTPDKAPNEVPVQAQAPGAAPTPNQMQAPAAGVVQVNPPTAAPIQSPTKNPEEARSPGAPDAQIPAGGRPSEAQIHASLEAQGYTDITPTDVKSTDFQVMAKKDGQTFLLVLDAASGQIKSSSIAN